MPWFKVDDTLAFHAKIVAAGNAAVGLWVRAGAWSAQQLTDGFIPDHIVKALGRVTEASQLVSNNLWSRVDGGYLMHDFHDYNPSRAEVEKDREDARQRMRRVREERSRSGERSGELRGSFARSSGDVRDARPDPSRTSSGSSRGRARSTTDDRVRQGLEIAAKYDALDAEEQDRILRALPGGQA